MKTLKVDNSDRIQELQELREELEATPDNNQKGDESSE